MTSQISVLVCGARGCGKTSLIRRITEKKFLTGSNSSSGVQEAITTVKTADGEKVRIHFREERFEDYIPCSRNVYTHVDVYIIVYDISNQISLTSVKYNCDMVRSKMRSLKDSVIIVGTKCDLKREIQLADIEGYANSEDVAHIKTSSLTNTNVNEMLMLLLSRKFPKTEKRNSNVKTTEKSSCCVIT